jgi:hypothetical protein
VAGVEAAAGFFARAGEPSHQAFLFHELAAAAPLLPPAPAWPGVPFPAFLSLFSATGASLIARADSPATISTALRAASLLPPPARAGCLPLFARAAERGGMLFGAGSAFEITRALAAAADAGADAPGMAGEADERAGARLAGGRGGDVAAAAGAFARVGCGAPRFFRGVAGGAGRLGGELGAGGLCGVVHAMAVLGHAKAHEQALRELWAGALGFLMKHGEAVSEPMRAQLYEAMVLAEADGVELPSPARAAVEDLDGGWRVEGALPDAGIFDPKSGDFDPVVSKEWMLKANPVRRERAPRRCFRRSRARDARFRVCSSSARNFLFVSLTRPFVRRTAPSTTRRWRRPSRRASGRRTRRGGGAGRARGRSRPSSTPRWR